MSFIYDESKEGVVDEESEIDKRDLELDLDEEDLEDEDIISEIDDY